MKSLLTRTIVFSILLLLALILTSCGPKSNPQPSAIPAATQQVQLLKNTQPVGQPKQPTTPPQPTAVPPPIATPAPVHKDIPTSMGKKFSTIHDQITKDYAKQKRAYSGDEFIKDRYERPFTQDMTYLPFIDLTDVDLNREQDNPWLFFKLHLVEAPSPTSDPKPVYGLEIDTNLDGRGDFLVMINPPQSQKWSVDGVKVFQDKNMDVGGVTPIKADKQPFTGDGYETLLFDAGQGSDPDLAWSRVDASDPTLVEIALKLSLLGDSKLAFLWGAFADANLKNPAFYDYNDHFTLDQAGSPLKEDEKNYPLKAFFAYDNTCRAPYGFTPIGNEPGMCIIATPPPNIQGKEPPKPCVKGPNGECI